MIALPNRKFSGQKIRERKYWNYKFLKEESLDENDLKILGAIELKGHEPTEYDFAVTVHSPNQIIIKKGKDFRQLVGIGDNVLSNLLFQ